MCLFVGSYDIERQAMLKKVLEQGEISVYECIEKISGVFSFLKANFKMYRCHQKLDYDVMIIPWRGLFTFPLAKLISKKPIVFMPTISIYNTLIEDRKKFSAKHPIAKIIHFIEKVACSHSDMIISESNAQNDFLVREYGISKKKCRAVVHSADESVFKPFKPKEGTDVFQVLFFGTFTPHHGTETIIDAANVLREHKDIKFVLCGNGMMKNNCEKKANEYNLTNIKFTGMIDKSKLISIISQSDICLGIFGTSGKAKDSITNKVCQILACQKPIITMDSKAMKEIKLENNKNCILVLSGSADSLANAILKLKNDKNLRDLIAINGYKTYEKEMSMQKTSEKLGNFLKEVIAWKILTSR